jgi:hypothetical protein
MKLKHKSKPQFAARYDLVRKKFERFFALHPDEFGHPPTAIELEACAVAVMERQGIIGESSILTDSAGSPIPAEVCQHQARAA